MQNENRGILATLLIWGLIAIGTMVVLSWILPSAFSIIGAAFWFFVGFFVARHMSKKKEPSY